MPKILPKLDQTLSELLWGSESNFGAKKTVLKLFQAKIFVSKQKDTTASKVRLQMVELSKGKQVL